MNEDPKWQGKIYIIYNIIILLPIHILFLWYSFITYFLDTNYVLSNYKTDQCQRPARLCRQGYACPQYHNSRDKRRNPRKYKYRLVLIFVNI